MKDSIAYLPKDKQEDLNFLVNEIQKRLPQTEFIILYGSYARGNYVRRSIRIEDGGIPTVKISDYDIYVITSGINSKKADTILDNVEDIFFAGKDFDRDTPVQFISTWRRGDISIHRLNRKVLFCIIAVNTNWLAAGN